MEKKDKYKWRKIWQKEAKTAKTKVATLFPNGDTTIHNNSVPDDVTEFSEFIVRALDKKKSVEEINAEWLKLHPGSKIKMTHFRVKY